MELNGGGIALASISAKPKERPCQVCKEPYVQYNSLQKVCRKFDCQLQFALKFADKSDALRKKAERKELREKKENIKRPKEWRADAQKAFNAYIRYRDRNELCICCDKPMKINSIGGSYDCGHFRTRAAAPQLAFNEDNAFGQRVHCNRFRSGNQKAMEMGIRKRIGDARVDAILNNNAIRIFSIEDYKEIIATFKLKLKELKAKDKS